MWWKLSVLALITTILVIASIPIRTHAVAFDALDETAPALLSISDLVGAMYLTPGSALLIIGILAVAGFLAIRIVRGRC